VDSVRYSASQGEKKLLGPLSVASYLSEYLICQFLLTSTYFFAKDTKPGLKLDGSTEGQPASLAAVKEHMLSAATTAVAAFTGLTNEGVAGVVGRLADFDRLARQVVFFLSLDYRATLNVAADMTVHEYKTQVQLKQEEIEKKQDTKNVKVIARRSIKAKEDPLDEEIRLLGVDIERLTTARALFISTYQTTKIDVAEEADKPIVAKLKTAKIYAADVDVALDQYTDKGNHLLAFRDKYYNTHWDEEGATTGWGVDLGNINGQMPVKEFEQLAYRLVFYGMLKQG